MLKNELESLASSNGSGIMLTRNEIKHIIEVSSSLKSTGIVLEKNLLNNYQSKRRISKFS